MESVEKKLGGKKESSWEKKRNEILESLERRVNLTEKLKERLDSITLDWANEKVERELLLFFENSLSSFSEETIERFSALEELIKKKEELEKELNDIGEIVEVYRRELTEEEYRKMELSEKIRIEKLETEDAIEELCRDLDISFLLKLKRTIESLIEKNRYIEDIRREEDPSREAIEDLLSSKHRRREIGREIKEVSFSAFDIVFDVEREDDRILGEYFKETPFIIIYNRDENDSPEKTIEHERIHNFLDISLRKKSREETRLENWIKYYEYLKERETNLDSLEREKRFIMQMIDSLSLVDDQQEEIIAGMRRAKDEDFGVSVARKELVKEDSDDTLAERKFEETTGAFSTAGKTLRRICLYLKEKEEKEEDDKMKDFFSELRKNIEETFIRTVGEIKRLNEIALSLGEEAQKKLDILFLMLKPTQYRHIETYLNYLYGEERIRKGNRGE